MTQTQKSLSEQALPVAPLLLSDSPDPLAELVTSAEQSEASNNQPAAVLATDSKKLDQMVFPTPNSPPMQQSGNQREEMQIKLEDVSIDLPSEDPATMTAAAADLMSLNVSSTMMHSRQQMKSQDQLLAASFDTPQSQLDMLSNLAQATGSSSVSFNMHYPPSISTSIDMLGSSYTMNNYLMLAAKLELRIVGNLDTVLYDW
jgi:hypothetical protein